MGKATGKLTFHELGECPFCDRVLGDKPGAQYHVQVQHGAEIARRIAEDEATARAGQTIHPYLRARASLGV